MPKNDVTTVETPEENPDERSTGHIPETEADEYPERGGHPEEVEFDDAA